MRYCNEQTFRSQFEFLKRQFFQDGGLPFTDFLSRETVEQALDTIEVTWNERIDTPLVTLWVFLGQVLSADHACRNAVARLVVHRVSHGLRFVPQQPTLTAKHESGCRNSFSPLLPAWWRERWKTKPTSSGFGRGVMFICSMAQRRRCLTRRKTPKPTHWRSTSKAVWAFPYTQWEPSSHCLVA